MAIDPSSSTDQPGFPDRELGVSDREPTLSDRESLDHPSQVFPSQERELRLGREPSAVGDQNRVGPRVRQDVVLTQTPAPGPPDNNHRSSRRTKSRHEARQDPLTQSLMLLATLS